MLQNLETFLTAWLGPASAVGAHAWMEAFAWIAGILVLGLTGVSLRRQSFQSRGELLLNLYERWEAMAEDRRIFSAIFRTTREAVLKQYATVQPQIQKRHLREKFTVVLRALRASDHSQFGSLSVYVGFFEVVGTYVKNGYVPMRDAEQLFKGSIIDLDIVFADFIGEWQQEAHMAPGLLKHALYLSKRAIRRERYWFIRKLL